MQCVHKKSYQAYYGLEFFLHALVVYFMRILVSKFSIFCALAASINIHAFELSLCGFYHLKQ